MKSLRTLSMLIVLALVSGALWPMAVPAAAVADPSKIDPRVADQLAVDGQADFFAILSVQADISGAANLATKAEKGAYVYNLLRATADQSQADLLAYLDRQGLSYRAYYIMNMVEVKAANRAAVDWFASRPEVAYVSAPPDPQPEPVVRGGNAPAAINAIEWNVIRIGAPDVWAMGFEGEGMVVGGNDTGVSYTHPALVNQYRGNLGGGNYNHNYNWWGGAGSTAPSDSNGHGTHTMGTMVGDDGGSNQIGVAPGAEWIACAGLGGADTYECFEWFLAPWDLNGNNPDPTKSPDSINNSWYDPSGFDYRPMIQNLNAAGIAVIKSAGNNGPGCSSISNPGYVPEIIATAAFNNADVIASFSSRGPSSNYGSTILKPEVAAPGVNVRSSVPGGGYDGTYSGTSMAAPHSTALVALMWNAAPCLQGDVPQTKQIMMDTADEKIDAQCPPFVGHPNDVWGWGILDAEEAVTMAMAVCGGQGGIDGTVTSGASALEGVQVRAEAPGGYSKTDTTDATGFYEMRVFSDTYTLTATKYGYQTQTVSDVDVTSNATTTVNINMPQLPFYTVSGYVRELGTNQPLAATVEFLDAPETPVSTNPSTGYYSIQVAAGTWHIQATAADHAPVVMELVVSGNTTQDFSLSPFCDVFFDDVENGNIGWTAQSPWGITNAQYNSPISSWTDSPSGSYANNVNTSLTSPVWDLTGYTGVSLTFWHRYATESGYDYCWVEWSTNGSTWTSVAQYDGTQASWQSQTIDLPELDGSATARIRFRLSSDGSVQGDGWYVDDITLTAGGLGCVPALAPTAEFSSDSPVVLGQAMNFVNETEGTEPIDYEWDFGDGVGTSTATDPSYTYTEAGIYTVVMTATNSEGWDDVQHTVVVQPEACEPATGVELTVVTTGTIYPHQPVVIQADVLPAGATAPFTYTVDGGEPASAATNPFTFTVMFHEPGSQMVEIEVENCAFFESVTGTVDVEVAVPFYVYLPLVLRSPGAGE